jgi:hypothetical protein
MTIGNKITAAVITMMVIAMAIQVLISTAMVNVELEHNVTAKLNAIAPPAHATVESLQMLNVVDFLQSLVTITVTLWPNRRI